MNLDLSYFDFIKRDELQVLKAIELGMRNHEWVPPKLIEKLSKQANNTPSSGGICR